MSYFIKKNLTNINNPVFLINEDGRDYVLKKTTPNEISILENLDSPYIPKLKRSFKIEDQWYLIETYFQGKPLNELVEEKELSKKEKLIVIKNCLEILSYLYKNKIVHRDLKPSHFFLDENLEVKLIDFDNAKIEGNQDEIDTEVIGTKGYTAPERYKGESNCLSDVFSIGGVLYYLINKHAPTEVYGKKNLKQFNKEIKEIEDKDFKNLLKDLCKTNVARRKVPDEILTKVEKLIALSSD